MQRYILKMRIVQDISIVMLMGFMLYGKAFLAHFLPFDKLWLFGSRVDDSQKGGDIDFYIETHCHNITQAVEKKIHFPRDLKIAIGDQKIDVVLNILSESKHQRIYDEAKNTGVQLI